MIASPTILARSDRSAVRHGFRVLNASWARLDEGCAVIPPRPAFFMQGIPMHGSKY